MDVILLDEIQDLIGATNATGGSTTAGTVMAKLNALLTSWTSTRAGYVDRLANSTYGLDKIKADTTTNNNGSKTGILSQKLSYLISLLENTTYGLSAIKTTVSSSGLKSVTKSYSSKSHGTATGLTQAQYAGLYSIYVDGTIKSGNGSVTLSVKGYGNRVSYDLAYGGSNSRYSYQCQNTYNNNVWRVGGVYSTGYSASYYHLFVENNVIHPGYLSNYDDYTFTGNITYYYFA